MTSGTGEKGVVAREEVRVAVDTGGTFTDVVAYVGKTLRLAKVPSTPADPAQSVLDGLRQVLQPAADSRDGPAAGAVLIHGSTVATNALLEGRVARVVLVTNRGFEDVLAIGRQNRPELYALRGRRPTELVPRDLRLGIAGRIGPLGEELERPIAEELADLGRRIRELGAEAVAITLLHSYANPGHEEEVEAALRHPGLHCSVSSRLLPEYREYERMSTTVVNAAVAPLMDGYLSRIEMGAGAKRVRVMGSGGGALSVERARRDAAHTILSGPAGGVAGALHVAAAHGIRDILTFDMGGTSTDVSLCPGAALHTREFTIAGMPVALPVLAIHTVGAGGGSIARVDAAGGLRVGPASAGAVPGPACYGRGGTKLTVTDANVALGRLVAHVGGLSLDSGAVEAPLRQLADALGTSPSDAAEGVIAVVNAAMEGALRVISVERGYDPSSFTLVPFGGAAGLHAVALADRLEVARLLVPPAPGVLSAFGMLVAPLRKDAARTVLVRGGGADLDGVFEELESSALSAMAEEGAEPATVALRRSVAARYRGQSHELEVAADSWEDGFHAAHERRFGYARRDAEVEAVTLRVEATSAPESLEAPALPRASAAAKRIGSGPVRYAGGVVDAAHYAREQLLRGHEVAGPALLLEATATFWLPPGWAARVEGDGTLTVER
ncbi:hydantoinase/oxoprolinase family protein [soil metagenome]